MKFVGLLWDCFKLWEFLYVNFNKLCSLMKCSVVISEGCQLLSHQWLMELIVLASMPLCQQSKKYIIVKKVFVGSGFVRSLVIFFLYWLQLSTNQVGDFSYISCYISWSLNHHFNLNDWRVFCWSYQEMRVVEFLKRPLATDLFGNTDLKSEAWNTYSRRKALQEEAW